MVKPRIKVVGDFSQEASKAGIPPEGQAKLVLETEKTGVLPKLDDMVHLSDGTNLGKVEGTPAAKLVKEIGLNVTTKGAEKKG